VLQAFGVADVENIEALRPIVTELNRKKFLVDMKGGRKFFVGALPDWPPTEHAQASMSSFSRMCEPEGVMQLVPYFHQTHEGSYIYESHGCRYIMSSVIEGPCLDNFSMQEQQRKVGEVVARLHEAAFRTPPSSRVPIKERSLEGAKKKWPDFRHSGLPPSGVEKMKRSVEWTLKHRGQKISELQPKLLVHNDCQPKNIHVTTEGQRPVVVDVKQGFVSSRLWDLFFILTGGDDMPFLPATLDADPNPALELFSAAMEEYFKLNPCFSTEESLLVINVFLLKAFSITKFFCAEKLPNKCQRAHFGFAWIMNNKDRIRDALDICQRAAGGTPVKPDEPDVPDEA
jgi:tRNA A-37 threonylcarbamoyl transferase component Bud32